MMSNIAKDNISFCKDAFIRGEVIIHPTEGPYGLGCDFANHLAVEKIFTLKQRSFAKNMILLAAEIDLILEYVDTRQLKKKHISMLNSNWPGPVTWVLPANEKLLAVNYLYDTNLVAFRVPDHYHLRCFLENLSSPMVSTSANIHGCPAAYSLDDVSDIFKKSSVVLEGNSGRRVCPSSIFNIFTLQQLR